MDLNRRRLLVILSTLAILSLVIIYFTSSFFTKPGFKEGIEGISNLPSQEIYKDKVVLPIWNKSLIMDMVENVTEDIVDYARYIYKLVYNSEGNTSIFWFKDGMLENIAGTYIGEPRLSVNPVSIGIYRLGFGATLTLSILNSKDEKFLVLHSTIDETNKWDSLISEVLRNDTTLESMGWIVWVIKFEIGKDVYIGGSPDRIQGLYIVLEQPFYYSESSYMYEDIPEMMYWAIIARPALSLATRFLYDESKDDFINYIEISRLIVNRILDRVSPNFMGIGIEMCNTPSKYIFNVRGGDCYQSGGAATYILSYGMGLPAVYVDDEYSKKPIKPWAFLIGSSRIYDFNGSYGVKFLDLDGDGYGDLLIPIYGRDIENIPVGADELILSGKFVFILDEYRPTIPHITGLTHSSLMAYLGIEDYIKNLPDELQTPWTGQYRVVSGGYGPILIMKAYTLDGSAPSAEKRWIGQGAPLPSIYREGIYIPSWAYKTLMEKEGIIVTTSSPSVTFLGGSLETITPYEVFECRVFCDPSEFRKPIIESGYKPLGDVNRFNVTVNSFIFRWGERGREVIPNLIGANAYTYGDMKIYFSVYADIDRITLLIGEEVKNESFNYVFLRPISPTKVYLYLKDGSVITIKYPGDVETPSESQVVVAASTQIYYKDYDITFTDVLGAHLFVYIELEGLEFQFIISFPEKL